MGTIAENILSKKSGRDARVGDYVVAEVDLAMAHDTTCAWALEPYAALVDGEEDQSVWDSGRILVPFDHAYPAPTVAMAEMQKQVRTFAARQRIRIAKEGVCHQVMAEQKVLPGMLVVGADSHTPTQGGLGAMACGVGSTDIAIAFRFGKLWFRVPKTMRVQICGKFARGVYPKDAMLFLGGKIGAEGAAYKSIEFYGGAVDAMSVASRMTLANFSSEMGAKCAIVPADEKTGEFIKARGESSGFEAVAADADAEYESEHAIDTANLGPLLACPNDIDNVKAVEQVEGIPVDQVFIGSCTNGRAEDLRVARNILEGRRIPDATRLIVCPASQAVMDECIADGTMGSLVRAGATVFTPGCGPCLGRHGGALADGETCVSTSNRNFVGRMGSPKAQIYLASPATAAATARTGQITDPRKFI